jgi:hypothetical protein
MSFREIRGDLFSVAVDVSLAHCISRDSNMSKGIAVIFEKKFGLRNEIRLKLTIEIV